MRAGPGRVGVRPVRPSARGGFFGNLTVQVLVAVTCGAALGWTAPAWGVAMKPLGDAFIEVVKWFVPPIVFLTLVPAIGAAGDMRRTGRTGLRAFVYFEVVTTFALVVGVLVAAAARPGAGVDVSAAAAAADSVAKYVKGAESFTWLGFVSDNPTLQVLLVSLAFGVALSRHPRRAGALRALDRASGLVFAAFAVVMRFAPIGAFGGMAFTVGKFGAGALLALGKLMASFYLTVIVFVAVGLGLVMRSRGLSVWRLLKFIRPELLLVLGTSSSESALPSLMVKLERFGCHKRVVGLVVPAGYAFNLDGTTIYLAMAVMFLTQAYGVEMGPGRIATLVGVLMLSSKGAAGVTGSGFVTLAATMQALKVVPLEGLALLLGVDRFMSEARALTNLVGNSVATVWAADTEGAFDREAMERALAEDGAA